MELKIIEEKQNPLFPRKEILVGINSETNPVKEEVYKILSEKFSSKPETIKINFIKGNFGSKEFIVSANIYDSEESKDKIEVLTKQEKEATRKEKEEKLKYEKEAKAKEEKVEEVAKENKSESQSDEIN